jgi:hypothetical protein
VPTTPNLALRYPSLSSAPNVPQDIQNLASDVDTAVVGRLKGQTTPIIADSATWTGTETGSLASVTLNVTAGVTYGLTLYIAVSSTVTGTEISFMRIREDTATGNQLAAASLPMPTSGTTGFPITVYTEYTAVSTGAKTFVVTGQRVSGTGSHQVRAGTGRNSYFTVEPKQR